MISSCRIPLAQDLSAEPVADSASAYRRFYTDNRRDNQPKAKAARTYAVENDNGRHLPNSERDASTCPEML
jgi:hypothetical protein